MDLKVPTAMRVKCPGLSVGERGREHRQPPWEERDQSTKRAKLLGMWSFYCSHRAELAPGLGWIPLENRTGLPGLE